MFSGGSGGDRSDARRSASADQAVGKSCNHAAPRRSVQQTIELKLAMKKLAH